MRTDRAFVLMAVWAALLACVAAPTGFAQKGKGESAGIARGAEKPETVEVSGKLIRLKEGPCEQTTGRAAVGVHLILQDRDGNEINLHLGPRAAVSDMVDSLEIGQDITAEAFRTPELAEHEYVARGFTAGDRTHRLRDEDLRPVWAGRPLPGTADLPRLGRYSLGGTRVWAYAPPYPGPRYTEIWAYGPRGSRFIYRRSAPAWSGHRGYGWGRRYFGGRGRGFAHRHRGGGGLRLRWHSGSLSGDVYLSPLLSREYRRSRSLSLGFGGSGLRFSSSYRSHGRGGRRR